MYKGIFILLVVILLLVFAHVSLFVADEDSFLESRINTCESLQGKQYYQDKRVILVGLLRDSEEFLPDIQNRVKSMRKMFHQVQVLILENDSSDNTRPKLLEWASHDKDIRILGCGGVNLTECKLCLPKTLAPVGGVTDMSKSRIEKMVFLRNECLDYIRKDDELKLFDFTIILDMDLRGNLLDGGLAHTGYIFDQNPNIDAIAASSWLPISFAPNWYHFYDRYAYVSEWYTRFVLNVWVQPPRPEHGPIKVVSAFSGIAIYRISKLLDESIRYEYRTFMGMSECEHISLNEKLNMVVDPQFVFQVEKNGNFD